MANDGDPELLVAGNGNNVAVLRGAAGATFEPFVYVTGTAGTNGKTYGDEIGYGNFDPDTRETVDVVPDGGDGILEPAPGDLDLAVPFDAGAAIYRSATPGGNIGGFNANFSPAQIEGNDIAVSDLNGDGDPETAITVRAGVWVNPANNFIAHFLDPGTTHATGVEDDAWGVAAGDLNGDGDPELVVANELSNNVAVLKGGPGWPTPTFTTTTVPVSTRPLRVVIADFDRDGKNDIAVATGSGSSVVQILRNTTP
jgi:hypothetical protein